MSDLTEIASNINVKEKVKAFENVTSCDVKNNFLSNESYGSSHMVSKLRGSFHLKIFI